MTTSLVEHHSADPTGDASDGAAPHSGVAAMAPELPGAPAPREKHSDTRELSPAPDAGDLEMPPESASSDPDAQVGDDGVRRTIKRYSNRKLYDTRQSRYVTLLQIAEMVRAGEDVQIIDNATKEDKTDVTLALIISEELKARPRAIPLATLKALIRHRGGRLLTQLRESPIGRLMPKDDAGAMPALDADLLAEEAPTEARSHAEDPHVTKEQPGGLRRTLEQWQHTIDDRIRAVVPHFSTIQELQGELQKLSKRLEELEKRVGDPKE